MFERNRHLADYSSVCICYLNKPSGGKVYTVEYAKKLRLFFCIIAWNSHTANRKAQLPAGSCALLVQFN